jgi:hypothetical protein
MAFFKHVKFFHPGSARISGRVMGVITQVVGCSCYGHSGSVVVEFEFKVDCFVYTYIIVIHTLCSCLIKILMVHGFPKNCCISGGGLCLRMLYVQIFMKH